MSDLEQILIGMALGNRAIADQINPSCLSPKWRNVLACIKSGEVWRCCEILRIQQRGDTVSGTIIEIMNEIGEKRDLRSRVEAICSLSGDKFKEASDGLL